MSFFIYTIQNKINNKIYIGKSNNPEVRWGVHKKVAKGGKEKYPNDFFAIHGALAKYGIDNFSFTIIQRFDDEKECLKAEVFWIEYFRSCDRNIGYNLSPGGDGASPNADTLRKMSEAQQGEKSIKAILTESLAIEIFEKYANGDYTQYKLADEYGVSVQTINDLLRHKTWPHLSKLYQHKAKTYSKRGELAGNSKLTENNVVEAIKLYNTGNYTYNEIAIMFGVKLHTIGAIIRGTNWKHIDRNLHV